MACSLMGPSSNYQTTLSCSPSSGSTEEGGKALPIEKKVEKPTATQNGLRKSCQNIGNPYQMEDNKTQGDGAKRRPLGVPPKAAPCCLAFGKDFLCFGIVSGAHSGSMLAFPQFLFLGRAFPHSSVQPNFESRFKVFDRFFHDPGRHMGF